MVKTALAWFATAIAVMALAVVVVHVRDMQAAYERIQGRSEVFSTPAGDIEFSQGGAGPAVLVVHGSGGGFDQGELLARVVLGDGFHWIAPSRFGYLRSTFAPGATFDDQAHAYVQLLDHLKLGKVAVVALSHGGPSALLFAAMHPERVSSLTLISTGVAPLKVSTQAQADRQGKALTTIFQHDFLYWAFTKALRKPFLRLMGADDAVVASLSAVQERWVDAVIDGMNPVSPRAAGVVFDNRAELPGARIAAIRTPTLVLHARDDTLQVFGNAEFAAATIPGAQLHAFDRGGHLLMVVEQGVIRELTTQHVLRHAASGAVSSR
jgi:pimeloyl-ACP methyl ester carboxylesterase